jgi:hypothetical protein
MNVNVNYSLEVYSNTAETGMGAYVTVNGVIVPQSWGVCNTRASDAESDQIQKTFRVDVPEGGIIRLYHWKKETNTHIINGNGSGGSLPASSVFGTGILIEAMRML